MPLIKVQAVHEHVSALPKDRAVNTFHFTGPNDAASLGNLVTDVLNFYRGHPGDLAPSVPAYYLASFMKNLVCRAYDMTGPPPHPPITETLPLDLSGWAGSAVAQPSEVAVCLSFQGAPLAGHSQARRRGRVYLGPINDLARNAPGDTPARPALGFATVLHTAASRLKTDATAHGYTWVVHSSVGGGDTEITNIWIDNEFDVQRRRGEKATARNAFTL